MSYPSRLSATIALTLIRSQADQTGTDTASLLLVERTRTWVVWLQDLISFFSRCTLPFLQHQGL